MHKRLRHIVIHLTASAAYGFIFLFALYDPVWFIIKPEWAAVILLTVITLSVEGRFPERLCLFVLGMCQGSYCMLRSSATLRVQQPSVIINGFQAVRRESFFSSG